MTRPSASSGAVTTEESWLADGGKIERHTSSTGAARRCCSRCRPAKAAAFRSDAGALTGWAVDRLSCSIGYESVAKRPEWRPPISLPAVLTAQGCHHWLVWALLGFRVSVTCASWPGCARDALRSRVVGCRQGATSAHSGRPIRENGCCVSATTARGARLVEVAARVRAPAAARNWHHL